MLTNIASRVTIRAKGEKPGSFTEDLWSDLTYQKDNVFRAMFNPETFSEQIDIELDGEQPEGLTKGEQKFKHIKDSEFTFDFLIDGTGASGVLKDVSKEVALFKTVTGFDSETHEVKNLTLTWGKYHKQCKLKKYEVKYTLFRPDGSAARCVISATFVEFATKEQEAALANRNSPDMTHVRVVNSHDRLPLMSEKIYRDPRHYLELARVNDLDNLRQLTTGQRIIFPPIDKQI